MFRPVDGALWLLTQPGVIAGLLTAVAFIVAGLLVERWCWQRRLDGNRVNPAVVTTMFAASTII